MKGFRIQVKTGDGARRILPISSGKNLRQFLLENGFSPYRNPAFRVNCGGMGICGTCRVKIREKGEIWFRRSCQIRCFEDLEIEV